MTFNPSTFFFFFIGKKNNTYQCVHFSTFYSCQSHSSYLRHYLKMTLLFVGRLPRYFDERDLEELFEGYGIYRNCKVRRGNRFGNVITSHALFVYLTKANRVWFY